MFALLPAVVAGCGGPQSALAPAGEDAAVLATLFWVMLAGAVVLWLAMNGLFFYVTRINLSAFERKWGNRLVIFGGGILPSVLLGALLVCGLSILPDRTGPGDGTSVTVEGEQFWWRVRYDTPDGGVVTANELRLPAGERTEVKLSSAKVIHSFWIPSLGGKLDMFPGRETRMTLKPLDPGVYRGQCAEFCGTAHALMAFEAVVLPADEFAAWLQAEAAPAQAPEGEAERRGAEVFARAGCGACHAVRGTGAVGQVGPDLTHIGSRGTLAAGTLGTAPEDYIRWIADAPAIKPGAEMPPYPDLSEAELSDLAAYLRGLE